MARHQLPGRRIGHHVTGVTPPGCAGMTYAMPHAPDLSGCALDDRYELQAVIGEGAFGRVYRGHDRRLKRTVAIKLIKPWWAEDPEWAQSFEREAQLLARVSDPGIVQIFDVGHAPEGVYYVSELVEGESLAARLARGPIAAWDAAVIAQQLCQALARAHAQSVVHRDVKPANILITPEGRVKVGDFGVARLAESSSDGAGATVVGTPAVHGPRAVPGARHHPCHRRLQRRHRPLRDDRRPPALHRARRGRAGAASPP